MSSFSITARSVGIFLTLFALAKAQNGAYFILYSGSTAIITEREDPILSPGVPSNHLHSILGANGFKATTNFADTQASTCSNFPLNIDKSNYWGPVLYFHAKNGSFIRASSGSDYSKLYYKYNNANGSPDLDRSEFPQGFRMITGNAQLRANDASLSISGNQLQWQCASSGGALKTGSGFPAGVTDCDQMFFSSMRFPSCWNGKDINPSNPTAHMAFPTNADGLAGCTAPYNVKRFPEIVVQTFYHVQAFDGLYSATDNPWVLSNGDPTGYSFHFDFLNGWVPGRLQPAMKTCNAGNSGAPLDSSTCFGSGSLYTRAQMSACNVPSHVNEAIGAIGTPLEALPGCNPIQSGPASATISTGCGAPTAISKRFVIRG